MVEAHYTLTLDDYREANGLPAAKSARTRRGWWKVLGWTLVVGGFSIFFVLNGVRTVRGGPLVPGAEPFPLGRLMLTMSPALGLCLLMLFFLVKSARQPPPKPWLLPSTAEQQKQAAKKTNRYLIGWVIFVAMAVIFLMFLRSPSTAPGQPAAPPSPTRLPMSFDFLLPFVPPLFFFLILIVYARVMGNRTGERMWSMMRHEHEPRTLRADAEGVLIEQSGATMRYAWSHFDGYKETANLLMLYLSPFMFHMVPKRAFATQPELDTFKGLLMSGIPEGTFQPTVQQAFPVVPLATVAPAPGTHNSA